MKSARFLYLITGIDRLWHMGFMLHNMEWIE